MKVLSWFKFSPLHWMSGRIQRCSEIAQARFLRVCCLYFKEGGEMSVKDAQLELQEAWDELVRWEIITHDDERIWIDFLDEQLDTLEELSSKRKQAAEARWRKKEKPSKKDASAKQVHASALKSLEDQIKDLDHKYPQDLITEFVEYWTEPNKSGTQLRWQMEKTWDIKRRLARWAKNNFSKFETEQTSKLNYAIRTKQDPRSGA